MDYHRAGTYPTRCSYMVDEIVEICHSNFDLFHIIKVLLDRSMPIKNRFIERFLRKVDLYIYYEMVRLSYRSSIQV